MKKIFVTPMIILIMVLCFFGICTVAYSQTQPWVEFIDLNSLNYMPPPQSGLYYKEFICKENLPDVFHFKAIIHVPEGSTYNRLKINRTPDNINRFYDIKICPSNYTPLQVVYFDVPKSALNLNATCNLNPPNLVYIKPTFYSYPQDNCNGTSTNTSSNSDLTIVLSCWSCVQINLRAATNSSSQIDLSWPDNTSDETGFVIERANSSSGPWSLIYTTAQNVTSYSNTNLTGATTYYYRVRAFNNSNSSNYSNTANATTLDTVPTAPDNLTASVISCGQIDLNWKDNSGNETGFRIERSEFSNGPWSPIETVEANVIKCSNTGLDASKTYYYRVYAYNDIGNSDYSYSGPASTPECPVPTAITIASFEAKPGNGNVTLQWVTGDETDNLGFNIYRSESKDGEYVKINDSLIPSKVGTGLGAAYEYIDNGVKNRTTYYYKLEDVDVNGVKTMHGPIEATPRLIYEWFK